MRFILSLNYCSPLLFKNNSLGFLITTKQSDMVSIHYPKIGYTYYFRVICSVEQMEDHLILIRPAILANQRLCAAVMVEALNGSVNVYPLTEYVVIDDKDVNLTKTHLFH